MMACAPSPPPLEVRISIPRPFDALLEQIRQGDREAFHQLYEQLGPLVLGYLTKTTGDPVVAQDLLQEVFLTVWRRAETFDPRRAGAKTWVFTIARNRWVDQLRRTRVRRADTTDPRWVDDTPSVDEKMQGAQEAQRLQLALDALPDTQQDVLRRSFFGFQSYSEIARDLGIALGTVKSRARLGFKRLRELLEAE